MQNGRQRPASVVRLHILEIESRLNERHGSEVTRTGKKWMKPSYESSHSLSAGPHYTKSIAQRTPSPPAQLQQLRAIESQRDEEGMVEALEDMHMVDPRTRMKEITALLELAREADLDYQGLDCESTTSSVCSSLCNSPVMSRHLDFISTPVVAARDYNPCPQRGPQTKAMRRVEWDAYKESTDRAKHRYSATKDRMVLENMQLAYKIKEEAEDEERLARKLRRETRKREEYLKEKEVDETRRRIHETQLQSLKAQQKTAKMSQEAEAQRRRRRMEEVKKEDERKRDRAHRRKMRGMIRKLEDEYEELKAQTSTPSKYYYL